MRVQALAVPGRAVPVPGLGHVPVPVAVRRVTVLAKAGIVAEPGRDYLVKAQRRPERLGDPPGVPDANRIPVAVAGGHAVENQVPLAWPAVPPGSCPARCGATAPIGRAAGPEPPARSGWPEPHSPRTAELPPSSRPSPASAVPGHVLVPGSGRGPALPPPTTGVRGPGTGRPRPGPGSGSHPQPAPQPC